MGREEGRVIGWLSEETARRMELVPDDVLAGMLRLLPSKDVVSCLGVCRRWRRVVLGLGWKEMFQDEVGRGNGEEEEENDDDDEEEDERAEEEEERMNRGNAAGAVPRRRNQPTLPVPHASWPASNRVRLVPRCGITGEITDDYMRSLLCPSLHLRWKREQIHSSCLLYTSLVCNAEPVHARGGNAAFGGVRARSRSVARLLGHENTSFYVPLPVHLSFRHHYEGGGGRGGKSAPCTEASTAAALAASSLSSPVSSPAQTDGCRITKLLQAAVRGADAEVTSAASAAENDRRRMQFITDVRVSHKYALVRASTQEGPCVIALNVRQNHLTWPSVQNRDAYGAMNASRTAWVNVPNELRMSPGPNRWGAMTIAAPVLAACVNGGIAAWKIVSRRPPHARTGHGDATGERLRNRGGREQNNGGGGGGAMYLSSAALLFEPSTSTDATGARARALVDGADDIVCLECAALVPSRRRGKLKNEEAASVATAGLCRSSPRWRVISGSASGRVAEYTLRCDAIGLDVVSSSAIDLDTSTDGVPTALEILTRSNRVAVGTSLGNVILLRVKSTDERGVSRFVRQASFSTVPTPVVQVKLCMTGGALNDSLVVLNDADPIHTCKREGSAAPCPPPEKVSSRDVSSVSTADECPVCIATSALRRRCGMTITSRRHSGFDNLESLWPKLATKKLAAMAGGGIGGKGGVSLSSADTMVAMSLPTRSSMLLSSRGDARADDSDDDAVSGTCAVPPLSLSALLHRSDGGDGGRRHCVSTLSMWYESTSNSWSPSWSRFVPVSQCVSTWCESFIVVAGVAATLFVDGHGRLMRKLPNQEVDMWTLDASHSSADTMSESPSARCHLKGRVVSCNAWCVGGSGGSTRTGDFQLVSATEIEFETSAQRTLSIQLHAPDAYGSLTKIVCGCGVAATKHTVTVTDRDQTRLFGKSRRTVYCCPSVLPGSRKRRCNYTCLH